MEDTTAFKYSTEDFKPNSHKYKEEQKQKEAEKEAKKVVTGEVVVKKKSAIGKIKDALFSGNAAEVVPNLFNDVLIPAVKKTIYDVVTNGADMLLNGGTGSGKKKSGVINVSYGDYYGDRFRKSSEDRSSIVTKSYNFENLEFSSRGDAELVISELEDALQQYGYFTVGDVYDHAGLTAPYTAEKYGWKSMRNIGITRTLKGYVINFPSPRLLDEL